MYEEITEKIKITVKPEFLDEHSDPDEKRFIWAYHVKIENFGDDTVKLVFEPPWNPDMMSEAAKVELNMG